MEKEETGKIKKLMPRGSDIMEILPHLNELTYTTSRPKSYSFQLKQAPGSKMIEPPTIHPASRQSEFYEI